MLKLLFKTSFKITNDCIIAVTPLIVFLSLLWLYYEYALNSIDSTPKLIIAPVTMIILFSGLLSAWLYMVKKSIALTKRIFVFDSDRAKAVWELMLTLPKGIGRLFLPILGVVLIFIGIYALLLYALGTILVDKAFDITAIGMAIVISFLTLFWIPEVVYAQKNPFKALVISIKNVCKNFKRILPLYLYIVVLAGLIIGLNMLLKFNPFLYFLVLIFDYYFLLYIVVLLFTYYEQEFTN